jgi:LysR family transcriptional regulator, glycine cleavage system transcriptional activator
MTYHAEFDFCVTRGMVRRFYNLPSLTALAAFEAVARHRSMTRAAAELNVTIGAISRQVKGLEKFVGGPLLRRERRGVEVTEKGAEIYGVLSAGFSQISQTLERIKTTETKNAVTVGASTAIASLWLMKRIGDFWRAHPDVTINHLVSDNAHDLRRSEVDLRIRYGTGSWPDESVAFLFRDYLIPVCGRRFLKQHSVTSVEALSKTPLLNLHQVDPSWTTWEEWFRLVGHPVEHLRARNVNNYISILNAAVDNQGVAIGWSGLIAPLLKDGSLVRFGKAKVLSPGAFYVTWNDHRKLDAAAEQLKAWLINAGAATPTASLGKTRRLESRSTRT